MWKMPESQTVPKGGTFLTTRLGSHTIFTPEDFWGEALEMGKMAERFAEEEVVAHEEELEKLPEGGMLAVLKKAGELGLFMADIPEEYGGLDLGFAISMLIGEKTAPNADFAVSLAAHVGIGTLPIVFYGNDAQRAEYLPKCASGELIGAYALSEPGSGSDALGARTKAVLNDAGTHYILNGTKQWITNAAWADFFVVFAKVDGTQFTGFLIDRDTPGFTTGPEENKLGLKGSSTRPLIFEDAPVPKEAVLGEVGRGHKIAFNILNVGRFKLGCTCIGGAKRVFRDAMEYASERKQFGVPVLQFGALQEKTARMSTAIYAMESLCYRIAGYMESADLLLDRNAPDYRQNRLAVIEEYAIEASIAKVFCSEGLHMCADESLQMYGGYGFVKDYPAEKTYRDCRVNRIFEGTNEINRLLIPTTLLKRFMKGDASGLENTVSAVAAEATGGTSTLGWDSNPDSRLYKEACAVNQMKKVTLHLLSASAKKYGPGLKDQQMVLMTLSDLIIDVYAADSVVVRTQQSSSPSEAAMAATQIFVAEATDRVLTRGRRLAWSLAPESESLAQEVGQLLSPLSTPVLALQALLGKSVSDAQRYNLSPH